MVNQLPNLRMQGSFRDYFDPPTKSLFKIEDEAGGEPGARFCSGLDQHVDHVERSRTTLRQPHTVAARHQQTMLLCAVLNQEQNFVQPGRDR